MQQRRHRAPIPQSSTVCRTTHRSPADLLGPPGTSWDLLRPPGPSWVLLGPPGTSWALLGPPGTSWVLLGPPGPSWDLLGRTRTLDPGRAPPPSSGGSIRSPGEVNGASGFGTTFKSYSQKAEALNSDPAGLNQMNRSRGGGAPPSAGGELQEVHQTGKPPEALSWSTPPGGRQVTGRSPGGREVTGRSGGHREVGRSPGGHREVGRSPGGRQVTGRSPGGREVTGRSGGHREVGRSPGGHREATRRSAGHREVGRSPGGREVTGRSAGGALHHLLLHTLEDHTFTVWSLRGETTRGRREERHQADSQERRSRRR
ncbi:hypothetical protein EYF80_058618 [Liparis tanakae]|uniref:Uncharacterized protein n=1 Tax=Liparis tanakae TaxID=230148 RepID=A0A4Z2ERJ6_9TELE|nr:hypothetical protein EYF80_058618 [Liparis tanakae]